MANGQRRTLKSLDGGRLTATAVAAIAKLTDDAEEQAYLDVHPELATPEGVKALQVATLEAAGSIPANSLVLSSLVTLAATGLGEPETLIALRARAQALHAVCRFEESVAAHRRVGDAHRRRGELAAVASACLGRILGEMLIGRVDDAVNAAEEARSLYRSIGDPLGEAKVDANLGFVWHRLDDCAEALRSFERARPVFVRNKMQVMAAIVDQNRALCHSLLGHPLRARRLFARARATLAREGQESHVATIDYNLAYDRFLNGDFDGAVRDMEGLRRRSDELGHPYLRSLIDLDLGEVFLQLGVPKQAAARAVAAQLGFETMGISLEVARARCIGAAALARLGRPDEARDALLQAIALFTNDGHHVRAALSTLELAELTLEADPKRAGELALEAGVVLRRSGFRNGSVRSLFLAGLASLENPETARPLLRRAAEQARRRGIPDLGWRCEAALAALDAKAGNYSGERRRVERAVRAVDKMRGDLRREDLAGWGLGGRTAVYDQAVRAWLRHGGEKLDPRAVARALLYAERGRSRLLADAVAAAGFGRGPDRREPTGDAERITELREQLDVGYRRLLHRRRGAVAVEEVVADVGAVELELEAALPPLELVGGMRDELSITELRRSLGAKTVLLVYHQLGDELWRFRLSKRKLTVDRLDLSMTELEALVADLDYQIGKFNLGPRYAERHGAMLKRGIDGVLDELGSALLGTDDIFAATTDLLVVPTGALHRVPFAALRLDSVYLCERRTVTTTPSGTVFAALERSKATGDRPPLVVGVGDDSIPEAVEEAREVARGLPGSRLLVGKSATLRRFKRELRGRRIVHVATHALFRPERPTLSSILLADGWLSLHDVYGLRLDADLVSLAACHTGRGQIGAGDEIVGLTRGFLHAGARSVLVSQWPVDDTSGRQLMTSFYRNLSTGCSKADSLRRAMLEEMKRRPHPYYWASFFLVGASS